MHNEARKRRNGKRYVSGICEKEWAKWAFVNLAQLKVE